MTESVLREMGVTGEVETGEEAGAQSAPAVIAPTYISFANETNNPMAHLADKIKNPPQKGDVVEGTIIELVRGRLFVARPLRLGIRVRR